MKQRLLDYIGCPSCGGDFAMISPIQEGGDVMAGTLRCQNCQMDFPVQNGIPRFQLPGVDRRVQQTVDSFGFEWTYFADKLQTLKEDREFLTLIPPLTPAFFKEKLVLDVGCGMGRNSRLSATYGAREVIGVDMSSSVESAFSYTRDLPNVHIIQADLHNMPLRAEVDLAVCLGVLHHIPSALAGLNAICRHVREDGTVGFWVYGTEGTLLLRLLSSPLRFITTRFSRRARLSLSSLLTHFLSLAMISGDYLKYFQSLSFYDRQSVVFDFLSTPIVRYYSQSDVAQWVASTGFASSVITRRNENSWGVVAFRSPNSEQHK